ncbi:MAG: twin-arginine translocation pathway signal protein [Chloroflexota bacterium]|nr:twin-arginine translocation pathway signal protein [Chloroflexota bacterium]
MVAACAPAIVSAPSPSPAAASPAISGATARPATTAVTVAVPSCVVRPALTDGPFFVDGKLDRSDIRSDPAVGAVSAGAVLVLTFNVSRVSGSTCTGLADAVVDLWQCDALGVYSDVPGPGAGRKFLRGFQRTDAQGRAPFTTVYPGWYQGRTVHLHFKIRSGSQEFSSQLFFDDAQSDTVFAQAPYSQRSNRPTRNANDGIYGQNGRQLTLQCTPSGGGSYAAAFDIGLSF